MLKRATDYRILGSFEVRVEGRTVALGGEKPRALLAILLLNRNEVVPADRLIDDLWGEAPPASALSTLRAYVSRLRKALNGHAEPPSRPPKATSGSTEGALLTRGRGYLLRVAPAELDLERFRDMTERGHEALAAGDAKAAARTLREALELWRGPPLTDFAYEPFALRRSLRPRSSVWLRSRTAWRRTWHLVALGSWWASFAIWLCAIRCVNGCAVS